MAGNNETSSAMLQEIITSLTDSVKNISDEDHACKFSGSIVALGETLKFVSVQMAQVAERVDTVDSRHEETNQGILKELRTLNSSVDKWTEFQKTQEATNKEFKDLHKELDDKVIEYEKTSVAMEQVAHELKMYIENSNTRMNTVEDAVGVIDKKVESTGKITLAYQVMGILSGIVLTGGALYAIINAVINAIVKNG